MTVISGDPSEDRPGGVGHTSNPSDRRRVSGAESGGRLVRVEIAGDPSAESREVYKRESGHGA